MREQDQYLDKYSEQSVRQLNKYQDIMDIFVQIIILRLPTVFVLINMILMIWLVQTIYTSFNADTVPTSLYFFAPLLTGRAITGLEFVGDGDGRCAEGWEVLNLKTFPTINDANIKHNNLTKWKKSHTLCIRRSQNASNFSTTCPPTQHYCSGICVNLNQPSACPITSIRRIYTLQITLPNQEILTISPDPNYKYVYSRENRNTNIVSLGAQYQYRCANEFHYWDTYGSFGEYWNTTQQCGVEGYLSPEFFHPFDSMATTDFLYGNGLWSQDINKATMQSVTELGYMNHIRFKNKTVECQEAEVKARVLQDRLATTPLQPFYSKNLLIISFVLFTLCWTWLIVSYCCQTSMSLQTKNIIVLLLSAIQFIAIAFIYYQNTTVVSLQNQLSTISSCIDQPMTAFQNWSFGLANRYPLICLIFLCSSFLLMELLCYFVSCCVYVDYEEAVEEADRREIFGGEEEYVSVMEED